MAAYVLNEVKKLKERFPNYAVNVTGHSLGGALGLLTALMLERNEIKVD